MIKKFIVVFILLIALSIGIYFSSLTRVEVTIFSELDIYLSPEVEIVDSGTGYSFKLESFHEIPSINNMIYDLHLVKVDDKPMMPGNSFSIRYYSEKGEIYQS